MRSIAQSISSRVMTSGGAKRIVFTWVSLHSRPSRLSASQNRRAPPASGFSSMPIQRPLPRISLTCGELIARRRSMKYSPEWRRVLDQPLLDQHLERRPRHRAGERVAAEGRAVVAGLEDAHDLVVGEDRRDRQAAAAERLADDHHVGPDRPRARRRTACRCGRGPTGSRRRSAARGWRSASSRSRLQVAGRRHDDPALALDRLDQDRDRVRA